MKVIITDDHPIVRKGIYQMLEECTDIDSIDEASEGSELISKMMKNDYDVVLLDISMPGRNGLEILKEIKSIKPKTAVLMLSSHPEEQYAVRALKLGASGYLTKASLPEELITAIRQVYRNQKYITSTLAQKLAFDVSNDTDKPLHKLLSERELEVMCLMAMGHSAKKIAEKLNLSAKTISTYRERILLKMNLETTADIIRYAIKEGLAE